MIGLHRGTRRLSSSRQVLGAVVGLPIYLLTRTAIWRTVPKKSYRIPSAANSAVYLLSRTERWRNIFSREGAIFGRNARNSLSFHGLGKAKDFVLGCLQSWRFMVIYTRSHTSNVATKFSCAGEYLAGVGPAPPLALSLPSKPLLLFLPSCCASMPPPGVDAWRLKVCKEVSNQIPFIARG